MKKLFLCAVLLVLFVTGCDSSDHQLKSRVPADAGVVCYMDIDALVKTKVIQDNRQELLDALKENNLTEDVFQCRAVAFVSVEEQWGGIVIQSKNGQAKQLFEASLNDKKKENPEFREQVAGKERILKDDDNICILYDDNNLLIGVKKNDPALFRSGKINPLFEHVNFKSMVSGAVKVDLSKQRLPAQAQQVFLMAPCLQKITRLTFDIPCTVKDPDTEIALVFQDDQSATEMLGLLNMGMGFIAQQEPDLAKQISRKCEKNAVRITIAPAVWDKCAELGRNSRKKSREIISTTNLKQIALGCKMYACDANEKYPDSLSGLMQGDYNLSAETFKAPFDRVSKVSRNKKITPANTTYAYVGKGLTEKSADKLPLAFEKPWLVPSRNGKVKLINVAFCDGSVIQKAMPNAKTCVDVVKLLTAEIPDSPDKQAVLRNAAAEDAARGK